jgi:hypothetical protein
VFAETMPGNATFLVDTYDSISGVYHAVEVGKFVALLKGKN